MAKQPKILIAEDDKFLRHVYEIKLPQEGFEVVTAVDGGEALEKLRQEKFNIVLLDVVMPKKNGFEVLQEMKTNSKNKNTPVIILSNLGQVDDIEKGRELGAIDYLVKSNMPINEVVKKIREYLKK